MEGKPPLALWFSHTGIIAYPPHRIQYLFSTPNTPLYSDIGYKKLQFGQYALRTNAPGEYEVTIPFHHPFNGIPVITIGFGVPNKNFEGYGDSHLVICNEKTTKNGFVVCLKTKYVSDCVYAINWVAIV